MRHALVVALSLLFAACARPPVTVDAQKLKAFKPLPEMITAKGEVIPEAKVALGRMLYYEPRLSRNQKISCNSCHALDKYGVDHTATSEGHKGQKGDRNSPTVYNAAAHIAQFWDGRAATVEEQAKGPMLNPVEMAMPSESRVVAVLTSMPEYVAAFKKAFPDANPPVTLNNAAAAIGAFERKLITPSRWDKYLKGDQTALTDDEKAGFNKFADAGCGNCHSGALVGGQMYQKLGMVKSYPDESDSGRFNLTKNDADKLVFKVPSLRNVEKTGPYFHNGKVAGLEQAIAQMAEYQLGNQLSEADVKSIATWLKALTGEIPADYIKPPELPKSTATTPKAETGD
jgi:cytochrome c peroxidase